MVALLLAVVALGVAGYAAWRANELTSLVDDATTQVRDARKLVDALSTDLKNDIEALRKRV